MRISDPDVALGIKTGGSILGFVTTYAWGYTGEFGATPGALSQSARAQWEMMPGHPKWDTPAGTGGQSHLQFAVKISGPRPSTGQRLTADQVAAIMGQAPTPIGTPEIEGRKWAQFLITVNGERTFLYYRDKGKEWFTERAPFDVIATVTPLPTFTPEAVTPPQRPPTFTPEAVTPPQRPPTFTPEERRALQENFSTGLANSADAALNEGRLPPVSGNLRGEGRLAPAPPRSAPTTVPDWTTQTEWAFPNPDRRLFQPVTNVDTGNRFLNVVLNKVVLPWRNALAFYENIPLAALIGIDDALQRTFPVEYLPAQHLLPLQRVFGLAVEAGPAIEYLAGSLSKLSANPRVLNAALFPVFGSLGVDGLGGGAPNAAPAANLQHVLTGGSVDRGIGVLTIDTSRLTAKELKTTISHVKDADFQAGIADGLQRSAVPTRSVADSAAALGRQALSLGSNERAGHLPDVAGGGNPLGPISGLPTYANSSIGGQWRRYAPGFTFDGFSLVDEVTGEFLYISLGVEHLPGRIVF